MRIIAGLGNPGKKYEGTRHNLGYDVLDHIASGLGVAFGKEKHQGLLAEAAYKGEKLLLVKPLTFMNRSGDCLAKVARNKVFEPEHIMVAVDDVNLPLGRLRLRAGGSHGGHNGLRSIIERLGSREFHRLRMGVGDSRETGDLADHVLARFRPDEREPVRDMIGAAAEAALLWVDMGIEAAMNRYN